MSGLTQEYLKQILLYDTDTGNFFWAESRGRNAKMNTSAGTTNNEGYIKIKIDGKSYQAHRLAWLYVNGYNPEFEIDHINRDKSDNKINNLRHVTKVCNLRNHKVSATNKSGISGVSYHRANKTWISRICINYKEIYLGSFDEKIGAAIARWEAEIKHGWGSCNAKSSAYKYIIENS